MFAKCSGMQLFDRLLRWWHEADTARRIRRHGFTIIYVGDYRTAPTWAYTVGFAETLGGPELVVFDVPKLAANDILSHMFHELKAGRLVIADGDEALGADKRCIWRRVHTDQLNEWLTLACLRLQARGANPRDLEAYQLVLSDADDRLPWEDGYEERLRDRQQMLYLPREAAHTP